MVQVLEALAGREGKSLSGVAERLIAEALSQRGLWVLDDRSGPPGEGCDNPSQEE